MPISSRRRVRDGIAAADLRSKFVEHEEDDVNVVGEDIETARSTHAFCATHQQRRV